ncbi:MAG: flippase, partial [candidate division KSB1 bacterium]|nr:flippase [candidate division KSB1 bacterium]
MQASTKTAPTVKAAWSGDNSVQDAPTGGAAAVKVKSTTLMRSSGIVLVGTILGRGLNFLMQVVLSNLLGLHAFGTYTYCNAILYFLSSICHGGFTQTTVRYIAIARANRRPAEIRDLIRLALMVMGVVTVIAGLSLYWFRQQIAEHWLNKPEIAPYLFGVAIALPGMVVMGWIPFVLRGFRDIAAETVYRNLLLPVMLMVIVTAIVCFTALTIQLALAALYVSIFITMLIGVWRLWRRVPVPAPDERSRLRPREVLKSARSVWIARFSDIAMNQVDRLLIGALTTLSQVGIYHAAFRVADFQTVAMGSFVPMFSTVIAEAHATGDREGLVRYYRMIVRWSLLVTAPICLACCLFAGQILRLFGPEFASGAPVLVIIALASLVDAGVGSAGQFLMMVGREKFEMICLSLAAMVMIALNVMLIPPYGAIGAAVGTGIAMVLLNLARLVLL